MPLADPVGDKRLWRRGEAKTASDRARQLFVHIAQAGNHPLADVNTSDLAQFEDEGVDDVLLFNTGLANEELTRLAVVIGEALRPQPGLLARFRRAMAGEAEGRILSVSPQIHAYRTGPISVCTRPRRP